MNQIDKNEQQNNVNKLVYLRKKVDAEHVQNMPNLYLSSSVQNINLTQRFSLNPSDFDSRGDFLFQNPLGKQQVRGKKTYLQPKQGWVRYGMRVLDVYEGNEWLMKDGNPKEWAVGFHGTNCSHESVISTIAKTNVICAGQNNGGGGQVSVDGKTIPAGAYKAIYFTWTVENCYRKAVIINGQNYEVAFQCRVHPDHIYDISGSYFVTDASRWVRPYGILMRKVP